MINKRKRIMATLALGVVLAVAAVLQFRGVKTAPPSESVAGAETERTVFGELRPKPTDGVPEIRTDGRASGPNVRSRTADRAVTAAVPADIHSFLDRWRTTMVAGDSDAHSDLYARKVERFFTKTNVSRDEVRREKQRMLARYPEFRKYDIHDVRLESMDGNRAVIVFRKDWEARGRGRFAGSEQQRLTLLRESGSWQIAREEEIKVY